MSNNNSSKKNTESKDTENKSTKNLNTEKENDAVTAVEVVKDDTVVYEDGDFDDYNADHNYETDADDGSSLKDKSEDKSDKAKKEDKSDRDSKSDEDSKAAQEEDKSDENDNSDEKEDADENDKSEEDDSSGMTMSGMFQWASKLREDFMSEATGITNGVTEKAAAMTLKKLIDIVDVELAAFDKSVEVAKKLIATAEEERARIASRKEKYQGMIDKLDQE